MIVCPCELQGSLYNPPALITLNWLVTMHRLELASLFQKFPHLDSAQVPIDQFILIISFIFGIDTADIPNLVQGPIKSVDDDTYQAKITLIHSLPFQFSVQFQGDDYNSTHRGLFLHAILATILLSSKLPDPVQANIADFHFPPAPPRIDSDLTIFRADNAGHPDGFTITYLYDIYQSVFAELKILLQYEPASGRSAPNPSILLAQLGVAQPRIKYSLNNGIWKAISHTSKLICSGNATNANDARQAVLLHLLIHAITGQQPSKFGAIKVGRDSPFRIPDVKSFVQSIITNRKYGIPNIIPEPENSPGSPPPPASLGENENITGSTIDQDNTIKTTTLHPSMNENTLNHESLPTQTSPHNKTNIDYQNITLGNLVYGLHSESPIPENKKSSGSSLTPLRVSPPRRYVTPELSERSTQESPTWPPERFEVMEQEQAIMEPPEILTPTAYDFIEEEQSNDMQYTTSPGTHACFDQQQQHSSMPILSPVGQEQDRLLETRVHLLEQRWTLIQESQQQNTSLPDRVSNLEHKWATECSQRKLHMQYINQTLASYLDQFEKQRIIIEDQRKIIEELKYDLRTLETRLLSNQDRQHVVMTTVNAATTAKSRSLSKPRDHHDHHQAGSLHLPGPRSTKRRPHDHHQAGSLHLPGPRSTKRRLKAKSQLSLPTSSLSSDQNGESSCLSVSAVDTKKTGKPKSSCSSQSIQKPMMHGPSSLLIPDHNTSTVSTKKAKLHHQQSDEYMFLECVMLDQNYSTKPTITTTTSTTTQIAPSAAAETDSHLVHLSPGEPTQTVISLLDDDDDVDEIIY